MATVRKKKKKSKFKDECTIPPALPKHVLSTLVMFSPRSKKDIADYVEIEGREKVLLAEKVKTEYLMGRDYECWDVHTKKERFYLLQPP